MVDYLTARAEYSDGNWQQAVDLLSKARTKAADAPDLAKEIDFWLGRSYQKQGKADNAIQAYRRAIAIDPQYTAARLMLAEALSRQGQDDQSLEQYRAAMGATPDVALQAARVAVQRNLKLAPADRNWADSRGHARSAGAGHARQTG